MKRSQHGKIKVKFFLLPSIIISVVLSIMLTLLLNILL